MEKSASGCLLGSKFIKIFKSQKVPNPKMIFRIGYGKIGQRVSPREQIYHNISKSKSALPQNGFKIGYGKIGQWMSPRQQIYQNI